MYIELLERYNLKINARITCLFVFSSSLIFQCNGNDTYICMYTIYIYTPGSYVFLLLFSSSPRILTIKTSNERRRKKKKKKKKKKKRSHHHTYLPIRFIDTVNCIQTSHSICQRHLDMYT